MERKSMREEEEMEENSLVRLCIETATHSRDSVETWRRQRRTLERLPSQLAEALVRRLLRRRLLFPSLLEVFKYSVEKLDLRGESSVDAEWIAYLGAFRYLHSLNVSDCHKINSSSLWALSGMSSLKEVDLSRCSKVTDAGIKHLLSIQSIEKLCISETSVTANGVTLLSSLKNLSMLDLGGLLVNDVALVSLQVLTKLQYLDLWGSVISNQGAAILAKFPNLNFLNLAWTKVTKLPNLSSLACLNMSNCTIHSILEGKGEKARLTKLILAGAMFKDVSEAFSYFETSSLSFLDLSNSSLHDLSFLPSMHALEYLDISGNLVGDDSVEMIASVGAYLKILNFSNTRVSSAGVGILAEHIPNLETISLSGTPMDDLAISYIGMIPSLKVVNLRNTNVKGLMHRSGTELEWVPSLTSLQNLNYLERLDLEETPLRDEALNPLSSFKELSYLSLKSGFLTDTSMYHLSSIPKLTNLSMRDAVLTNAGIDSFNPPPLLKVLDLSGCWLLTEEILLSFRQRHPQIEVRHELVCPSLPDHDESKHPSPSRASLRTSRQRRLTTSPLRSETATILDQRLKYSREELLSLQFVSLSVAPSNDGGTSLPE